MTGNKAGYIDAVCNEMLPPIAAEGLADAVDAFCEGIAFSVEQTAQVFAKAQALGLPVRLHADQLSNLHGAALAARFGALSADHLEYADEDGVAAMARAGTVAVVLPGAFYFIRERQSPPIDMMRASWRADRACDRQQSRHVAADLPAADHEHGRDACSVSPSTNASPR